MSVVFDFSAMPPEVNSGRMYAGPGSGPMMAAASAWDGLAAELNAAAQSYQSVISELTGESWLGPASASMSAAAAPYVAWMNTTAAQAAQTAEQARSAAAAYEAAFAATVPPPVITANRAQLATLVQTNTFGQNTSAIAANQAHYAEMWAQDAAAMYSYASASAAAAQVTPFSEAPNTTNPAAPVSQAGSAAATDPVSAIGAADGPFGWLIDILNSPFVTGYEGLTSYGALGTYMLAWDGIGFSSVGGVFAMIPAVNASMIPFMALVQGAAAASLPGAALASSEFPAGALGSTLVGSPAAGVGATAGSASLVSAEASAGMGRAASVGGLSVPQSWGSAAPEVRLASTALPMAGRSAAAGMAGLGGGLGGAPLVGPIGSVVNAPRNGEPSRYGSRVKVPALAGAESGGNDDPHPRWTNFNGIGSDTQPISARDQVNRLRRAIAAVGKERDVLKRSAALLIKEATQR